MAIGHIAEFSSVSTVRCWPVSANSDGLKSTRSGPSSGKSKPFTFSIMSLRAAHIGSRPVASLRFDKDNPSARRSSSESVNGLANHSHIETRVFTVTS